MVPAFATQMRGLSGCAHSIRSTLKPPTITFSTQKSSRVANTLQPKNNTPASGTKFAATSTRALGDRRRSAAAADGVAAATRARIVLAGTPVYRATYSGLLKVFFDLLPQDSLLGKIGVPIVTGHDRGHSLAVDHGLRPLFASLGATVVASGVYGTSAQFQDGKTAPELLQAVDRAVEEALALAGAAQH